MKINENTTSQEVKEKTMNTLVQMCNKSDEPNDEKHVGEDIGNLFDMARIKGDYHDLEANVIQRILEVQKLLIHERKHTMSIEEILRFLSSAMNYGKFQLWLWENKSNGIELNINDKLKKFFSETTNEEILGLYDIEQNYNKNNIEKEIGETSFASYGMLVDESSNEQKPVVTKESRSILARNLINPKK